MRVIDLNTTQEVKVGDIFKIGITNKSLVKITNLKVYGPNEWSNFVIKDCPCVVFDAVYNDTNEPIFTNCATSGGFFGWEIIR